MTNDAPPQTLVQPGVFLDGGVLISLFQFWDACRAADAADRLDEISGWMDLKAELDAAGVFTEGIKNTDAINRGINSFTRLTAASSWCLYYSSHICWSDVHHTLLEARGLEGLVRNRVPQSLRVKRPQMLYRVALQESDYDDLRYQMKQFRDSMELDYGIDVVDVEDPSRRLDITPSEIWDGARKVWSRVLMDVLDAYLCAAATLIGADIFISGDEDLRAALEMLSDESRDWTALREALGMASDAAFPKPQTPRHALPSGP